MASSHRVTDFEKNPVRISKDEAPTRLDLIREPVFIGCFILFSQFILVCFITCKNEKVLFVLVQ